MSAKAIFLDRDGTLIEDPGYISHPNQVELLPGTARALVQLKQLGYKLIVVSNQSGVARGMVTEKTLGQIHHRLKQLLAADGAYLDQIYYCPYHPEGAVAKYRKESGLRKPNPGMLLLAAEEMDIDLSQSWMVGDKYEDVSAGRQAGCKTILINPPPYYTQPGPGEPNPDYQAVNIKEAANIVKRYSQMSAAKPQADSFPAAELLQADDIAPDQPALQAPDRTESPSETRNQPPQAAQEPSQPQQMPGESQQLLHEILGAVRGLQRSNMYDEFSTLKLVAGILQMIVLLCLLLGVWFLLDPSRTSNSVLIALGFSAVFQLMSLTLYIMHGKK